MQKYLSLSLKMVCVLSAVIGILIDVIYANPDLMLGRFHSVLYFTIQSNIWIALVLLAEAYFMFKPMCNLGFISAIKLVFTVSISLTGFVYCFVLAPTMQSPWSWSSIFLHVFSPLVAIIDMFVSPVRCKMPYKVALYAALPPIYYLFFSSLGYILGWEFSVNTTYPYFFMNWGSELGAWGFGSSLPFMGVCWWVVALSVFVIGMALLYIVSLRVLDSILKKK